MSVIDCDARVPRVPPGSRRRIRQRDLRVLQPSNATISILPAPSTRSSSGLGVGALAAHHRDERVARPRMHGQIGDGDLPHVGAEQRGNLLIDRGDALSRRRCRQSAAAPRSRAKIAAACVSAANKRPVGREGERPDGCRTRVRACSGRGGRCRRGPWVITASARASPNLTGENRMSCLPLFRSGHHRLSNPPILAKARQLVPAELRASRVA